MNIALWIVQGMLAIAFGMAGFMKVSQSKQQLLPRLPWVKDFPAGMVKFIGIAELLGAVGMVIPMLTGLPDILTPLAATGLCTIMVLASIYHGRKQEWKGVGTNAALFLLAAFVAFGRF